MMDMWEYRCDYQICLKFPKMPDDGDLSNVTPMQLTCGACCEYLNSEGYIMTETDPPALCFDVDALERRV